MSKSKTIEIGDVVSVNFHAVALTLLHEAKVLNVPASSGDSWIFEDRETVHYISEGCTVSLIRKGQP